MDEQNVRSHAQRHARAVVEGDLRSAARDLAVEARGKAGEVMQALPSPLEAADVTGVEGDAGSFVVRIRYGGAGRSTTVRTRWEDRDEQPRIVDLEVEP
jgi:hypothetical protein